MHKVSLLREWFAENLPDLARNPERLAMFVNNGAMRWRNSEDAAPSRFAYEYDLEIIILDWEGHIDAIMHPLSGWIVANAPELANPDASIPFESVETSATLTDIVIKLKLCENVQATKQPDGSTVLEHFDEPVMRDYLDALLIPGEPPLLIDIDNPSDPAPDDIIPPPWSTQVDP